MTLSSSDVVCCTYRQPRSGEDDHNKEITRRYLDDLRKDKLPKTLDKYIAEGDLVNVRGIIHGVHNGKLMDSKDASLADFEKIAGDFPTFHIVSRGSNAGS